MRKGDQEIWQKGRCKEGVVKDHTLGSLTDTHCAVAIDCCANVCSRRVQSLQSHFPDDY